MIAGPFESHTIAGRRFICDADDDAVLQMNGKNNELKPNGDGTNRNLQTRVVGNIDGTNIVFDKIDRKTAEAEFARYCDENDIDCNMDAMSDEEKADFKPMMDRFVKACMQGRLEADGVNLNYTISDFTEPPFRGKTITIKRPGGHAFMGMDGYKETQSVHRIHGFLSAMTGQEVAFFTKIDWADWLFFRDMATLFLVG